MKAHDGLGRSHETPQGHTSASIRSANLALVLRDVLAASKPLSRAEVASRLRLTRSTVSRLVDELIEGGLLAEGEAVAGARGRPATPLGPQPGHVAALGMEVNTDRLSLAVVDLANSVVASETHALDVAGLGSERTLAELQARAITMCSSLPSTIDLVGACLTIPGLVDREGTTILRSPNLQWDGARPAIHFRDFLRKFPLAFRLGNDVDASALTVINDVRAAREATSSFIYVTGEVGIGAAITLDGQLMTGRHGWASELGHMCVDPEGNLCGCGARGCLESVAGLTAVLRRTGASSLPDLIARLDGDDRRARLAMIGVGRALGQALGAALNLLDLTAVVLGGYLASCSPWLLPDLKDELARRVLWAPYSTIDVVTVSEAPQRAARGAAMAALAWVIADPAGWLDRRVKPEPYGHV